MRLVAPAIPVEANTILMLEELVAMDRAYDSMIEAAGDFSESGLACYEQAKCAFYAANERVNALRAVLS